MQIEFLLIDVFLYALLVCVGAYVLYVFKTPPLKDSWSRAFKRPISVASGMVLLFFLMLALLDSIHVRPQAPSPDQPTSAASVAKNTVSPAPAQALGVEPKSILDLLLKPLADARERSYSAPLAMVGFKKETFERDGLAVRDYPRLKFGGAHLSLNSPDHVKDCWRLSVNALIKAMGVNALFAVVLLLMSFKFFNPKAKSLGQLAAHLMKGHASWPIRTALLMCFLISLILIWVIDLSAFYHVFGTDQTGKSVLLIALKSVRTALVIGTLTTLVIMPVALILGVVAGYFRGAVDEFIQYVYTLLASIPDVLLIAATVLMLQVFIDSHSGYFDSALQRSDARLFFLCLILALTSFTGLCRLVRGETLKLRELEYIQSAKAFGVSTPRILLSHIAPNLMHLVLINCVMQFSGFILSEAVLSYVGVGVDPNTASFGVMINTARDELAATPVVWWTLVTAFVFMFLLVISANLLADAVRDAFDPKTRLSLGRST
jgi:peptide/nickel transport system permease protein